MSINLKTLQTIMCAPGISGRRGLRALFWGKPGVGKTAAVEAMASAMGALLITIIASIREPSDFLGIPMPDGKGGVIYAAPGWARMANAAAEQGQLVVVFVDEITTCAPAVQAALLRVVNEGWVGDLKLHPNVVFIAAANPPEIAAGGYDLSPPMANRWMHIDWADPSAAQWSEGILSDWADTANAEDAMLTIARIEKNIDVAEARAKGLVTGFLRAASQHLITLPDMSDPNASRAWPSLRTWELAIKALAGCEANGLPDTEQDMLIEGCVGRGVAGELRQYQAEADLPNPATLLDAKKSDKVWRHNPERPDITAAVLNSCAALVTPKQATKREERGVALWRLVDTVVKDAGDLAVTAGRALARAGHTGSPTARKVMVKMGPIMQAMGDL
jgi:MoxR-like ATPase